MMRTGILFAIALLAWPGFAALAADPSSVRAFLGQWKGDQVSSEMAALPQNAFDLRVQSDADGFRISWHDLGTNSRGGHGVDAISAQFLPTDRQGVYEYAPKSGSLLTRMFASPSTGNPLKGETLLWARVDDLTLAVYSMKVDPNGGFILDHYSWTPTENGLRLRFSSRTEDIGVETEIEGDLVAEGG